MQRGEIRLGERWLSGQPVTEDGSFFPRWINLMQVLPDCPEDQVDVQVAASGELTDQDVDPTGKILTELVGQSQTDDELAVAYRARYSAERRPLAVERMRRAQEAGQLRPDFDLQVLVDQLWGAVYHRLLIPYEPITDEFITALVNNLLDGVGPPASY